MQANTNDRFLNIRIFAGLLECVRKICVERLIEHLAIADIQDVSQSWYRDFFRLAGFYRCRCQSSASGTLQLETRNCLSLRRSLDKEWPTVYKMVKIWLAEGRCTRALLDSIASGEASEVERRYFHDLCAELNSENHSQSAQAHKGFKARDQARRQSPWQEYIGRSAPPRRKTLRSGAEAFSSREPWCRKHSVVESMGGSASRVRSMRRRMQTTQIRGLWRTRKAQTSKAASSSCKSLINTG